MIEALGLQHTRGVPLRNLCLLCAVLRSNGSPMHQRDWMLRGKDLGLRGFESVQEVGSLPTRVRHHLYSIEQLELARARGSFYSLTDIGYKIGSLAEAHDLQPSDRNPDDGDMEMPEAIQEALRRTLCASWYVRHWWLRYFMPREEFSLEELVAEGRDIVVELVPPRARARRQVHDGREISDTGYRLHSYFSIWESVHLDESARREIYEGLRKWALRVELVSEVAGWESIFEVEHEYQQRIEAPGSRLDRIYIVRRRLGNLDDFEVLLHQIKVQMGNKSRIRIPELTIYLSLQEGLSLKQIHQMLEMLYPERASKYFFETASAWLLKQPGNRFPIETYILLDGAWRTSIVFES